MNEIDKIYEREKEIMNVVRDLKDIRSSSEFKRWHIYWIRSYVLCNSNYLFFIYVYIFFYIDHTMATFCSKKKTFYFFYYDVLPITYESNRFITLGRLYTYDYYDGHHRLEHLYSIMEVYHSTNLHTFDANFFFLYDASPL